MKSNAIIRIILFTIVILILASLLGFVLLADSLAFNSSSFGRRENTDGNLSSSGEVDASQIKDLEIEWVSGSITIIPTDSDKITFTETGASNEDEAMIWKQSGDRLIIQFGGEMTTSGFNFFGINTNTYSKDLEVCVPKNWICDKLNIESVSARIDVSDLAAGEIALDNVSGICDFDNCTAEDITLNTVSGDIRFNGTLDTLECEAVSANCTAVLANVPTQIRMDGVSGDLDLTLPADCGFTASIDATSGDFTSDFPTITKKGNYTYGDEACRIDISGVSGDITIRSAE